MSIENERTSIPDADASSHDLTPLDEDEQLAKDMSYSPGSERETAAKQSDPEPAVLDPDIDRDAIRLQPGTGGPDDAGDVDVDPEELHLPQDRGAD